MTAPAEPFAARPAWTGERLEAAAAIWKSRAAILPAAFGGVSMRPAIPPGGRVRVLCGTGPGVGDVCAFVGAGRLIVHRVAAVSADGAWLVTRGDANLLPDAPIRPAQVLGRVVAADASAIPETAGRFPAIRRAALRAVLVAMRAGTGPGTAFVEALWRIQRRVFSFREALRRRRAPPAGQEQGPETDEVGGQRRPVDGRRQGHVNEPEEVVVLERPGGGEPDQEERGDR